MSVDQYRRQIERLIKDRAQLEKELSRVNSDIVRLTNDIGSIQRNITSSTSLSTLQSKQRQIESKNRQLDQKQKKYAELQSKISDKLSAIGNATRNLERAEEQDQRKRDAEDKRRREAEIRHARNVTQEIQRQARLHSEMSNSPIVIDMSSLPEKITVVFFAANPQDQDHLALDEEVRLIEQKLRASEYRDSIVFKPKWAVRSEDLFQALNEHRPHIIHFSGHGNENNIAFLNPDGTTKLVTADAMAQFIATMGDNIRVVVFNTCLSAKQAEAVTEHIDVAIGMTDSIDDEAARTFSGQFYSAIGFGHSIQNAFKQGINALLVEGYSDASVPKLYTAENVDPNAVILVRPQ